MNQVYLIGNAHIDPMWLWRYPEGESEVIATFRSALDRIKQFDGFVFTSASALFYRWVEETSPDMFQEIKEAVSQKRWCITGGMWIQPDCNIPSGESFARQMLYAQRYFQKKFGITAQTGYNVDSFGHAATIPMLLNLGRIKNYVFMRPDSCEKKDLPSDPLFIWQYDKYHVNTYRIPDGFGNNADYGDTLFSAFERHEDLLKRCGHSLMLFYGVGNHGGGPTIRTVEAILDRQKQNACYLFSDPDTFFSEIKTASIPTISTVQGPLRHHSRGAYASSSNLKHLNRKSENALVNAEKWSSLCGWLLGKNNVGQDQEELDKVWEEVMLCQFHDVVSGCCVAEVQSDAENMYRSAVCTAKKIENRSVQKIAWNIDTDKNVGFLTKQHDSSLWQYGKLGTPVIVFNPLSWEVDIPVRLHHKKTLSAVTDSHDRLICHQLVRAPYTGGSDDLTVQYFNAHVPAMGYEVFGVYIDKEYDRDSIDRNSVAITETSLENDRIKILWDRSAGNISGVFRKENGESRPIVRSMRVAVYDDDQNDTWGHGLTKYSDYIGEFGLPSFRILEKGDALCTLSVTQKFRGCVVEQQFSLTPGSEFADVSVHIFNPLPGIVMKLEFSMSFCGTEIVGDEPYGFSVRVPDGNEDTKQAFVLSRDQTDALVLADDGQYSYSAERQKLTLTVLRSCRFADHFGIHDGRSLYHDMGELKFCYAILPCQSKNATESAYRVAAFLNTDFPVIRGTYHKGELPCRYSGIEITDPNIALSVWKQKTAADGDIVRLYNAGETLKTAKVVFTKPSVSKDITLSPGEVAVYRVSDHTLIPTDFIES